jgi:CRP/FNR family cyclic AMP-dependent transcriptional regulator
MHWNTLVPDLEAAPALAWSHMTWGDIAGYAGAALFVISFFRKTMIPLRALGAMSNLCFVAYGYLTGLYPMMVLHMALFPLNGVRLYQMMVLVRRVRTAAEGNRTMDWLRPFMSRRACRAGEVLFRKGDLADSLFYTVSGRFRLDESNIELPVRVFVGELGLLAPDGRRTQTLKCDAAGELLVISYDQVKMLYFQNPDFGFYFMQLATSRLFQNLETSETLLAAANARINALTDAPAPLEVMPPGPEPQRRPSLPSPLSTR